MKTYVGILVGIVALLLGIGVIDSVKFNLQFQPFIANAEKSYIKSTKSYESSSSKLATAIGKVNNKEKFPSLEDKMRELNNVFKRYKPEMQQIASTDKALVDELWNDLPYLTGKKLGVGIIYPPYQKSHDTYQEARNLLYKADRHVAAEQFIADNSQNYFPKIAKFQIYLQARAVFELSEVFTSALPADEGREVRLEDIAIEKYSRSVDRHIPGTVKIVNLIPLPDHPYYKQKRQKVLDMLARSKEMYKLYLKADKTGDKNAKQQADKMAKENNGELTNYVNVAAGIMLSPLADLSALDKDMQQLFTLDD